MINLNVIREELPKYFQDEILDDGVQSKWLDLIIKGDKMSLVLAYNSMSKDWQPTKGLQEHLQYKWQKIIKNYLRKQENPSLMAYDELVSMGESENIYTFGVYGLKEHHLYTKIGNVWYPKIAYDKRTASDIRKDEYQQQIAKQYDTNQCGDTPKGVTQ